MAWNTRRSAAPTLPLLAITPHTTRTATPPAAHVRWSRRRQRDGTGVGETLGAVVVTTRSRASTSWAPSAPRPRSPWSGGSRCCTSPPHSDVDGPWRGHRRTTAVWSRERGRGASMASVVHAGNKPATADGVVKPKKLTNAEYEKELERLQIELLYMQEWIQSQRLRLVVLFEGRDTAGKGGTIKRITELLNPRFCKVVALAAPSDRERTQWYFQRYVTHLPAAGEIVLFDRSWYNRAGVERVMKFCTDAEYEEFMRHCPQFERALIRDGIMLVKYWLSISDEEQERRFQRRIKNPHKRWKLSTIDLEARAHWVDYSEAKDDMFAYTDIKESPWWVINSDDKRAARLNLMAHLLSLVPHEHLRLPKVTLPPKQQRGYERPPMDTQS